MTTPTPRLPRIVGICADLLWDILPYTVLSAVIIVGVGLCIGGHPYVAGLPPAAAGAAGTLILRDTVRSEIRVPVSPTAAVLFIGMSLAVLFGGIGVAAVLHQLHSTSLTILGWATIVAAGLLAGVMGGATTALATRR